MLGSTVNTSISFSTWGVERRDLRYFEEEIEGFKMTQVSSLNSPYREKYGRVDGGTQPSFPTSGRIHICRFLQSRKKRHAEPQLIQQLRSTKTTKYLTDGPFGMGLTNPTNGLVCGGNFNTPVMGEGVRSKTLHLFSAFLDPT